MSAAPKSFKLAGFALWCCAVSPLIAQEMAAVTTPVEQPPTVEKFEEPAAPAPGQTNNSAFRFTYPVRDSGTDRIYTEANPPAQANVDQTGQTPAVRSSDQASQANVVTSFQDSPVVTGQEYAEMENLPSEPEADIGEGRFSKRPFRFSFAVYEGYNSNVNGSSQDAVESLYTSVAAGFAYDFGSSRLTLGVSLDAALAFYYNNEQLQNDGLFPTITLGISADYKAAPQLDLSFITATALLSQPDFAGGGGGPRATPETTSPAPPPWPQPTAGCRNSRRSPATRPSSITTSSRKTTISATSTRPSVSNSCISGNRRPNWSPNTGSI